MAERKTITKHINRFLLDPNNYRFIDRSEYKHVPDDQLSDLKIQLRTYNFLVGKNNENISDLIASFKTNGFLSLDQIQVKSVGDYFLILEGNRRIATLKYLYEEFTKGNDVGKLTETTFKSVSIVEIVEEDPKQHLITMGLHHISGKKRWSPVNQAQLIADLLNKYHMDENDVCDALGISKQLLRRSLRTLALIESYKKSDYGDQFETNMFSIFEEVIRNTNIKDWISWDDYTMIATNTQNQYRLFSWISRTEEIERDEDGEDKSKAQEPIITKSREIRELSKYIKDEPALKKMEESRSISEGFAFSDSIGEARLRNALNNIRSEVQVAFNFSEHMMPSDLVDIARLRDKFDKLLPSNQDVITIVNKNVSMAFAKIDKPFESIFISQYRKLLDLRINHLNRVNIFAGGNNTGKTSILEGFYLLSQINDLNAVLDLEQYRGKFYKDFHSKSINRNFHEIVELSGIFNNVDVQLSILKEETEDNIDKANYLSTIKANAIVNNVTLTSNINLFSNKEPELYYLKTQKLCQASFTSPYRYNGNLLKKAHANAINQKYYDDIIEFIKVNMDSSIEKIEMVNYEDESRFVVNSSRVSHGIDITKYGEGLQRVFEIALLMGYSKDGIICIDEIDSAIHKSLLFKFTEFIQRSADKFNVQVFLSTHSKECIDAFIANKYNNDNITAYALNDVDGKVICKYIKGTRLEDLIESINIDIR